VSGYGLNDRAIEVRSPAEAKYSNSYRLFNVYSTRGSQRPLCDSTLKVFVGPVY
jgi:hypothetical protein